MSAVLYEGVTVDTVDAQISEGRSLVPDHLWPGVRRHILEGIGTGNFLAAVFANDLLEAACGADEVSLERLPDIMRFMHNYAPAYCWGSRAIVVRWRRLGGVAGRAFDDAGLIQAWEQRLS